ncbi:MAG: nitric-oxide reductase, partial [Planctomycetes bacterium]|nr:nitric-oxide reductase [Planctomycetota bacterium]
GSWKWKWALSLQVTGMVGMTMALLIAGYEQSFIERALGGSTWYAYFQAQNHEWFIQAMIWRQAFGYLFTGGVVLMLWDMLTIGRAEDRSIQVLGHDASEGGVL